MDKIKHISSVLRILFSIAFILLPAFTVLFWLTNGYPFGPHVPLQIFPYEGPPLPALSSLGVGIKMLGFLINLIPITIYMIILGYLIRLFSLYGRAQIFSMQNVTCIRRIGWAMLIGQIIKPVYTFLLTLTLTFNNPPGRRFALISVNFGDVAIACAAIVIILISWIMEEGHKLEEEQSYTV